MGGKRYIYISMAGDHLNVPQRAISFILNQMEGSVLLVFFFLAKWRNRAPLKRQSHLSAVPAVPPSQTQSQLVDSFWLTDVSAKTNTMPPDQAVLRKQNL